MSIKSFVGPGDKLFVKPFFVSSRLVTGDQEDSLAPGITDGGQTFSDPINLSKTTAGAGKGRLTRKWDNGSLDLALWPEGDLYAAWTEYKGALRFTRSGDGGATFSKPVQIAGSENVPARAPTLAAGADGTAARAQAIRGKIKRIGGSGQRLRE